MENELISIIVPIYNNKNYLMDCINSILIQTYQNIEIILIDDGSNDGSDKICDKYVHIDSRIRTYYIKNRGVSYARNYGLEKVNGNFVCFVDSDDYINSNYIEKLYTNMIENNADISVCGHNIITRGKSKKFYTKTIKFIAENNHLDILLCHKYFKGSVWDKMYKTQLIKNIRFSNNLKYYEDLEFNYKVFKKVKKIVYDSTPLYNYNRNPNSALNKGYDKEKLKFINLCNEIEKYYIEKKYNLIYINTLADYLYICTANSIARRFSKDDINDYKKLITYIKENILRIVFKDKLSFRHKLAAIIMFFNEKIYIYVSEKNYKLKMKGK